MPSSAYTLLNVINNRVYADEGTVTLNGDILTENDEALNHLYFTSEKLLFPEGMKVKKIFRWTKEMCIRDRVCTFKTAYKK